MNDIFKEIKLIRSQLTMGRCALLRWIVEKRDTEKSTDQAFGVLAQNILKRRELLKIYGKPASGTTAAQVSFDLAPQLDARISLIRAVLEDGDIEQAIEELVRATQDAWKHTTLNYVREIEVGLESDTAPNRRPSCLPLSDDRAGLPRFDDILESVARVHGWSHPGVLMAGEILALLYRCHRKADLTVRSKIMFAMPQRGVLANITLERVSGGCGLLIPDAMRCGYLWMDADFSTGLQNALWAARNYARVHFHASDHAFDWRWSVDLLSATANFGEGEKQTQIQLSGRSAEVVLACAMIAAHGGNPDNQRGVDPLDPHVGATASIMKPGDAKSDKLKGVGAIDDKTLVDRMQTKRLLEVVIAQEQTHDCIPPDRRFEFRRADTLADAYQLLTRFPRLTRQVNRHLALCAKQLREARCDPYVLPEIAEEVKLQGGSQSEESQERPLTKQQVKRLVTGRSIDAHNLSTGSANVLAPRIFMHGDSGLGKSVFILLCEQKIAEADNFLLPIRLGRCTGEDSSLASIDWRIGTDAVIDSLSDLRQISEALVEIQTESPAQQIDEVARRDWFRWLVRNGRVVFLLDALDQVEVAVLGLGAFLSKGNVAKCPVIMTGRPEAREGRAQAFQDNRWRVIRIKPFDRKRQTKYLGSRLAEELIPANDELNWNSGKDEIRKHQWKDLLGIPLLLNLLKQLAEAQDGKQSLSKIHSRYDLYQLAVEHLIKKGWESAEREEERQALQSPEQVFDLLGKVAWYLVRQHHFTGILNPDQYKALAKELGTDILDALPQIDITTAFQVLEQTGKKGLAFRHRSFMEFFAGRFLMDSATTVNPETFEETLRPCVNTSQQETILKQIHETLDANGNFLPHMLSDRADRPGEWNDTLRFALSHARDLARDQLALRLIELGNPWAVYESIARDHTEYSQEMECLASWLVHRDWPKRFDYRPAVTHCVERWRRRESHLSADDVRSMAEKAIRCQQVELGRLTRYGTRDAAYLSPLREILPTGSQFYVDLSAEQRLADRLTRLSSKLGSWNFSQSFVTVGGGEFDLSGYPEHKEIRPQQISISDFALADFPVTNELFELFCPSHRRFRDQYSSEDDQPAIWVSHYMAVEFCDWLSSITGMHYHLPDEWEWEWACRWRNTRRDEYWWGNAKQDELCWYGGFVGDGPAKLLQRTRSRSEAITAFNNAAPPQRHPSWSSTLQPGLLDMLGNVWEWCQNLYDDGGSFRVGRGGSWNCTAWSCRSANRFRVSPDSRYYFLGFRVSLVPSVK